MGCFAVIFADPTNFFPPFDQSATHAIMADTTPTDLIPKPVVPKEGSADKLSIDETEEEVTQCEEVDVLLTEYQVANLARKKFLRSLGIARRRHDIANWPAREKSLENIIRIMHRESTTGEDAWKVPPTTSDISPFSGVVLTSFFLFEPHLTE
jgi:hypothetical protein